MTEPAFNEIVFEYPLIDLRINFSASFTIEIIIIFHYIELKYHIFAQNYKCKSKP